MNLKRMPPKVKLEIGNVLREGDTPIIRVDVSIQKAPGARACRAAGAETTMGLSSAKLKVGCCPRSLSSAKIISVGFHERIPSGVCVLRTSIPRIRPGESGKILAPV